MKKAYTFHGNGSGYVTLRDEAGELHCFHIADIVMERELLESLGCRANFLIGMDWHEYVCDPDPPPRYPKNPTAPTPEALQ